MKQPIPDKTKLKSILKKIWDFGKEHCSVIAELVIKYWDKLTSIF